MWGARYWAARYWGARYWGKVGTGVAPAVVLMGRLVSVRSRTSQLDLRPGGES